MKRRHAAIPVVPLLGALVLLAGARQPRAVTNSIGMKLVLIEPGSFRMGSSLSRDTWEEQPVHDVTLSDPFLISETEVTIDQFRQFEPDFVGTPSFAPFAAGVSWNEACAFTEWLALKEGRPYRLPTEAEWEYVARAGSDDPRAQARGEIGMPNAWGVKNLLAGVREWCLDWFGEYPAEEQTDPVGPEAGIVKIVRGGALDLDERNDPRIDFLRPQSRLAIAPSFGPFPPSPAAAPWASGDRSGLIGVWYRKTDLADPQDVDFLARLDNNWSNDPRGGGRWSGRWRGALEGPHSGEVFFSAEVEGILSLEIRGKRVVDTMARPPLLSGTVTMVRGEKAPLVVTFARSGGSSFRIRWQWPGQPAVAVPSSSLSYGPEDEKLAVAEARTQLPPGFHAIGFRVVQAALPSTRPSRVEPPYVQQGVKQSTEFVSTGPDSAVPYFRKRYLLPTPLENSPREAIDAVGMHPSFRGHNHSPALEALPNGDLLLVIYTSYNEYETGVSLIASRLRFGADEWDIPSPLLDFVGINDHAPLLWNDDGTVRLFWGSPQLADGGFPFQWTASRDNGASWDPVQFPHFIGRIGSHTRQPINTAFRSPGGRIHVSSDGSGGESVLWASDDDGASWFDLGGRSAGRHTSFAMLRDGRILALGGKNTHIDEYMPRAISRDGGRSYEVSRSPFTRQGTNQRPTLLRLRSGKLLFAGDFVYHNNGSQPTGVNQLGSYVALSDDEGETWHIRRLIGAQLHEDAGRAETMKGPTLGYCVARQAPNGMIHLVSTMTKPCLHFEFNEAWILDESLNERPDVELMGSKAKSVDDVRLFEESYPNGKPRIRWHGGVADDGRFLLHGSETWFYDSGAKQHESTYRLGAKIGVESYWSRDGMLLWSWEYREEGTAIWRRYWPGGALRSESSWKHFKAHGTAKLWSRSGEPLGEWTFSDGSLVRFTAPARGSVRPGRGRVRDRRRGRGDTSRRGAPARGVPSP
jgi:hypothetical protein